MKLRSFLHKGLRRLYVDGQTKGVPAGAVDKLRKRLAFMQDMEDESELRDLALWKVHQLTGDRKGDWSLWGNSQRPAEIPDRCRRARNLRCEFRGLSLSEGVGTMRMTNAPHPGDFIRTEIIEPLGLSVTAAAKALAVSRPTLSSLLNSKADLSGDMALRIEKAFGVKMDTLLRMQASFDISKTRKRAGQIHVKRYSEVRP